MVAADGRGHDVDDGIRRANFVKMNSIHGNAVDLRFGFGQAAKNIDAGFFDRGRESAALEKPANLSPSPRWLLLWADDVELQCANRRNGLLRGFEIELEGRDFLELRFERGEGQAEIEQGGDEHVAAHAADQVAVGYPHPPRPP